MTSYPETCLIDHQDGDRTVLTVEGPTDCDTESGAVARLTIDVNSGNLFHQMGLSQEACSVLARRLTHLAGEEETEQKLRKVCERLDARLAQVRSALTEAGVPETESCPDEEVDDWEKSLRTGGRVIPTEERIRRLADELERAKSRIAELEAERITLIRAMGPTGIPPLPEGE